MSGPKVSSYELEQQRRRRLEEEARRRQRELEEEMRRKQEAERRERERIEAEIRKENKSLEADSKKFDEMISSIHKVIEQEQMRMNEEKQKQENSPEIVEEKREHMLETDAVRTIDIQELMEQIHKEVIIPKEHEHNLEELVRELQQGPMEIRSLLDAYVPKEPKVDEKEEASEEEKFDELLLLMEKEYQEILQDRAFFKQNRERILRFEETCKGLQEYRTYGILRDVYYDEFAKIKKAQMEWHALYEKWREPFDEAYRKYCAICKMVGRIPAYYYLKVQTLEEDIKTLETEAEKLYQEYVEQQELELVTEAFNEVMEEMGYQVLGTKNITKKSTGKTIKNTVFSYGEGSGIHVIDNGESITMQVVGLEDEPRAITTEEREYLVEEQESFCESYFKIHEELAKRGIVMKKQLQKLPPSAEYASLLSMNGYTFTPEKESKKNISKVDKKATKKQRKIKHIDE